ncbi:hypothetical protein GGD40_004139 [Paraburkholderia bryophila]|uniref:Uncharacterized protein n=1 Tax=Paraburkholderia bryophila TaxID=420952 RepID=A0A7Y9WQT0_9BURK|nr:hypothetical protein [Paraburkholderia bryophila]
MIASFMNRKTAIRFAQGLILSLGVALLVALVVLSP